MSKVGEVIQQIKLYINLVSTIEEHVQLSKAGKNLRGRCPFHSEDTPSFFVSPQKGIWRCFGCGKGGDVINFVAEINRFSNSQAIRVLSNRLGINNTGRYRKQIEELAKQRALNVENQQKFKEAMQKLEYELEKIIQFNRWLVSNIKTEADLEHYAFAYDEIAYLEHLQEELLYNTYTKEKENEMYVILKELYLEYKSLFARI